MERWTGGLFEKPKASPGSLNRICRQEYRISPRDLGHFIIQRPWLFSEAFVSFAQGNGLTAHISGLITLWKEDKGKETVVL